MPRPAIGVWLATAIWVGVVGGLWGFFDHQLKTGTEISLKAMPVDPRDPLRGDYVILRYAISTWAPEGSEALGGFGSGQVVYASVEREGEDWKIVDLGRRPPEEGLFLRGRVRRSGNRLEVRYGVESYFVPEGEGRRYEEARNRDRLWAVVSVSPHGLAHLKRLEIR